LNAAYAIRTRDSALNTLGYVLLAANRIDEAILVFEFNARMFRNMPNVHDSLGEALAIKGEIDPAIEKYKKVLELDPKNKHAKAQIKMLKKRKREVL